jgi:sn-glycerol 3-phosphate transport system ATP-binding protein
VSAIAVENVSKHWTTADGQVRAVDAISFELAAGTFNVLLGPRGAASRRRYGSLRASRLPMARRVIIDGRDVTGLPPAQRNIAMVFQSYALFPPSDSRGEHPLRPARARVSEADCGMRLARVAELLGLSPLLARKPSQLSGGQQQRVALGRAIINEAKVCLMDEPLSNLDAQLRAEMRLEIRALQRKLGITMVYVTHDQVEAMSMADRVILLNGGRIEQNGTPVELYEQPANTFVARFIGTPPMNLLKLEQGTGGAIIQGADGPALLPAQCAGGMLGVRPEHIGLAFEKGVRAGVESVEYLGGDSLIACRIGVQPLAVRTQGNVGLTRGDAAWLTWAPGAQHFFAASGVRERIADQAATESQIA